MWKRCRDPENIHYGARGISVNPRWMSFENFLADMGERPEGRTLDRINNAGAYGPENCRWATPSEQLNNRRTTRFVTYHGRTQSASEWGVEVGISGKVICSRLDRGWAVERALTEPVHRKD